MLKEWVFCILGIEILKKHIYMPVSLSVKMCMDGILEHRGTSSRKWCFESVKDLPNHSHRHFHNLLHNQARSGVYRVRSDIPAAQLLTSNSPSHQ